MGIHLRRLDFTSTVGALLCMAARHAVTADGATQQALDEIAVSLNNVAAIVGRHGLAGRLNGPIPAVPEREQPGGDGPEAEELAEDEAAEEGIEIEMEVGAAPGGLHPRQARIWRFIRRNPGCTAKMVAKDSEMTLSNLQAQISLMRKAGVAIEGTNTRPTRYHIA